MYGKKHKQTHIFCNQCIYLYQP
ncbi:MAG: hypothetical protein E3J56_05905 [Candidatus Aminicenantes bacterium]|nr:MAG: hypothetical protein E3J56_05905 [Candidatus Aminicenantes bacterium]